MTGVRYLFVFALCTSGCDCSQSHTRDAAVDGAADAADDARPDTNSDTSADAGPCSSPVLYDDTLCRVAPDVGFCVFAGREEEAQTLVPTLRCGTALPSCDDESVSCRYGQEDSVCDGMSVVTYNRAICALWEAGVVTEVVPIPLD